MSDKTKDAPEVEPEEVEAWKQRKTKNAKPKERRVGGLKALEGGLS